MSKKKKHEDKVSGIATVAQVVATIASITLATIKSLFDDFAPLQNFSNEAVLYVVLGAFLVMLMAVIKAIPMSRKQHNDLESDLHNLYEKLENCEAYKAGLENALEKRENIEKFKRFKDGFESALEKVASESKSKKIEKLDIFARNGRTYGLALASYDHKIQNVRLLVSSPELFKGLNKNDGDEYKPFNEAQWIGNVDGIITKPINNYMKHIGFIPSFHFAIINEKWLFYGEIPTEAVNVVSLTNDQSSLGDSVLKMYQDVFDSYYNGKSFIIDNIETQDTKTTEDIATSSE
jgi:hypothetical protein